MYDSADTKRLSKELLQRASEGEVIQVQCTDADDTGKTFNRLNVQRHRQGIKNVKINYNTVTFALEIVRKGAMSEKPDKRHMSENPDKTVSPEIKTKRRKRPTMLAAAPEASYAEVAERAGVDPHELYEFAKETAEAINAQGGLEEALENTVPWEDVKAELGLDAEEQELPASADLSHLMPPIQDQGELGSAVAISTTAVLEASLAAQEGAQPPPAGKRTRARAKDAEPYQPRGSAAGKPPTPDLWDGKQLREKDKCFHCGGPLIVSKNTHYHERVFEKSATVAFPVTLCCHCVGHKVD